MSSARLGADPRWKRKGKGKRRGRSIGGRPALSHKQLRSLARSTGRVNLWEGSIRSGKTYVSWFRWMAYVATQPTGGALVIIGKTIETVYRNLFEPIANEESLAWMRPHVHYKQGATTARILGQLVHIIGANDAKAEPRLRGMTIVGAYVDELTVLPKAFFVQLLGRMSPPGAALFATTNPDSPGHWLMADYLSRMGLPDADGNPTLGDWRRFHFTLLDNPALTEEYKRSLAAEFTGLFYRRFVLGEWVAAEGAVYDMFDSTRHVVKWDERPPVQRYLAVGLDHGTQNPTHAVLLGLTAEEHPRLLVVDEYRISAEQHGRRFTDAEQSRMLRAWMDERATELGMSTPPQLIVDPAAASMRVQLQTDGKATTPADNDVLYGIRTVSSLLGGQTVHGPAMVVTDRCVHLIREAPGYSWDEKKQQEGVDAPVKVDDHALDAWRYAVATTERAWSPLVRPSIIGVTA